MRAPSGKLTRNHVICKNIAKFRPWKPCGFTFKISSRGHRHLVYIVERNTRTDGMGPFKRHV